MSITSPQCVVNAMTVDVEDYFHISGFADMVRPAERPRCECLMNDGAFVRLSLSTSVGKELKALRLLQAFGGQRLELLPAYWPEERPARRVERL